MEKDLNKENLLVEEKEDCNLTTSSSNSEDENLNNIHNDTQEDKKQNESSSKTTKSKKKNNSKKTTIITASGCALALLIGGVSGFFIAFALSPKGFDYDGIENSSIEDDVEAIYENYLNSGNKNYLSYSPSDLANIAIYKYSLNEFTSSDIRSDATSLGVVQRTVGQSIKNSDEFFNESISHSTFVKVAKRFYSVEDGFDIYSGNIQTTDQGLSAEYTSDIFLDRESYEDTWGKTLDRPVIYNISSKTVLEGSSISQEENGNYIIDLKLDPVKSVVRYVKQMIQMSSLSDAPEFDFVNVTFEVDSELNLLEMNVHEAYYVWVVGKNYTEAYLTETFHIYSEAKQIPSVEEKTYYED